MRMSDTRAVDIWRLVDELPAGERRLVTIETDQLGAAVSRLLPRSSEQTLRRSEADQVYMVLQGQGLVALKEGSGETRVPLKKGAHFLLAAGTEHRFINLGKTLMIVAQAGKTL